MSPCAPQVVDKKSLNDKMAMIFGNMYQEQENRKK